MNKTFNIFALLCFGVAVGWFFLRSTPRRAAREMCFSAGTLGEYKFSSPADVKAFNSEIIGWLSQRGFAPCTNQTFAALAASVTWPLPGLLVSHRYNPTNEVWVFIPEGYDADSDFQTVGCGLSLRGTVEEVNQYQADFSSTQREFRKRFPSREKNGEWTGKQTYNPVGQEENREKGPR
jgi:hypothetical protein